MSEPLYIIGIDLGTTNTVVAYTEAKIEKGKSQEIKIFEVPQITYSGTIEEKEVLPSFILVQGGHGIQTDALKLPWKDESDIAVGEFAKERGAELPNHVISSSKSWLCNQMVDRNKPILPWGSKDTGSKKSPVESSSSILEHIKEAWNYKIAKDDDNLKIENQEIYLTVPASFDAVARDLTIKASKMAGLSNVTLLEEPQAAFYSWIYNLKDKWRDKIKKGDIILVCDIGGGTTDFSLIKVSEEDGELLLERVAVGNHLLVGGDNMDMALAYSVSSKLSEKKIKLDPSQMRALWHSCRNAKEKVLAGNDSKEHQVAILGRGSKLIGGTIKATLSKSLVEKVIIEGFFPKCEKSAVPSSGNKLGLKEFGLQYESDPSVTKHLAKFLSSKGDFEAPTAILYNGGVMKSQAIRERIKDIIASWRGDDKMRMLESSDLDLAVALGAAYYGLARRGQGVRIRGGLNKSYYIGVAASLPAVPGMPIPLKAICVGTFGMEEGTQESLKNQEFTLIVGEPVKFDFLGSSVRFNDNVGSVIEDWETDIEKITTIEVTLEGEYGTFVPVTIEVKVTEIGTLELFCVSRENDKRWKLEFNVREKESIES
ncbi:MAG: Hsp70 family protein [Desulfobacterales bacterium]|nr:Hsp70 family protein [Desulfobacterales bacterium]MBF0398368.1 Hsp70 family protein [Desulfobacterales bacterium]